MTDWISFEGRIVSMEWGESTYTVLPIPDDVSAILTAQGARRVEIELNDHPYNLALTKAPSIASIFVYTGKAVLRETSIKPNEPIEVRIRKANPNEVEVPDDVLLLIRQNDLTEDWEALSPGKQRGLVHSIVSAKRPETREKRIAALVLDLSA